MRDQARRWQQIDKDNMKKEDQRIEEWCNRKNLQTQLKKELEIKWFK